MLNSPGERSMDYDFRRIEKDWQEYWRKNNTYRIENGGSKPRYYVLEMFPYPSGAGLHVGHPLGYIAGDIVARFKRHQGCKVLHPMGYDSFGLPAEQYAIQTGQHPAKTTEENIKRYREQLDLMGFSYDWSREVKTSDPKYYRWTQWIFLKLFNSWYNTESKRAEPLESLIARFEKDGSAEVKAGGSENPVFSALQWKNFSEKEKSDVLMQYRLAYLSETFVNWCPQLGTVLANEEVKDGVSERGGYPVERKLMPQWSLRITAYADRLLQGLEEIQWSESIKDSQRNWIGKSEGASVKFQVEGSEKFIEVFTTRPDTIFGATFMVLAPEHELLQEICTADRKAALGAYCKKAAARSERERMMEVKKITGEFTGAYAKHPFTGKTIPIWTGDYVLAGYGTGAVMAVPGHDSRDHAFARHFGLDIVEVVKAPEGLDIQQESYDSKEGEIINSAFLNGLKVPDAIKKIIGEIESRELGKGKVNYRLRDAIFGRQRYLGEPIPVFYENGIPKALSENELPLELPEIDKYLPTETGEPPLARAKGWKYKGKYEYEKTTMPGWAGSSWYYLRYMDAGNEEAFAGAEALKFWGNIDLYIGGSEHATGHLLYVRFWTKFLKDLGYLEIDEPAKKLVNQGMIQGESAFLGTFAVSASEGMELKYVKRVFYSGTLVENEKIFSRKEELDAIRILMNEENLKNNQVGTVSFSMPMLSPHIPVQFLSGNKIYKKDFEKLIQIDNRFSNTDPEKYVLWEEDQKGQFLLVESGVEKMSKSKFNVVNPDEMCEKYGADTFRMYEMFLGPLELSKPWNTNGITGVHNFLKKFWKLYAAGVSEEKAAEKELKVLHKTLHKITGDMEKLSFNTCVSAFMIAVNELTDLKCNKRAILEPLAVMISPFAPHIAEEVWKMMGHLQSITMVDWPVVDETWLKDDTVTYPIQFNGKMRFNMELPSGLSKEEIEKAVLEAEASGKYLDGKSPKKVIVVPGKIVNVVV
jgi:leucyl-tRNA synthetase